MIRKYYWTGNFWNFSWATINPFQVNVLFSLSPRKYVLGSMKREHEKGITVIVLVANDTRTYNNFAYTVLPFLRIEVVFLKLIINCSLGVQQNCSPTLKMSKISAIFCARQEYVFFYLLFGCPSANFGTLWRGGAHSFDVNHCVVFSYSKFTSILVMRFIPSIQPSA